MGDISNQVYAFQSIARIACRSGQPGQRQNSRFSWMLIGTAGTGTVFAANRRHVVGCGGGVMGDPGALTLQGEGRDAEWRLLFVEFVPLRVTDEPKAEVGAAGCRHSSAAGELGALAERLFSVVHVSPESPQRMLLAHLLVQQMVLWWQSKDELEEAGSKGGTTDQAILAALRYMESHYAEPLTREQLADKAGIAHTYFSVLCKKLTGMSPFAYLERLRVHRAAELLLDAKSARGDLTEIARQSGFRDSWYMSKRFRKRQGLGPSAYRSEYVPERPVSLQYPYTHHLLELGIAPAAARLGSTGAAISPAARAAIVELPGLLSVDSQREWLRPIEPQLILTYDGEQVRERLRGVAPVVHIPWLSMNWREHMLAIGRLFHKETAARERIAALDRKAAAARSEVHAAIASGTCVSIFKIAHNRCYLYGARDAGCIFYEFLDFVPHPYMQQCMAQDRHLHSVEIPFRRMAEFAGELNAVILYPDDGEHHEYLRLNEHWRRFETAAGSSVVFLEYREWLHYDPLNIAVQLGKIAPILLNRTQ